MGKINKFVGHENDEEIATLKYNDIELRIGYTYIHALRSIFSTADFSSGDSLRDHSIFAKIIDNIEQEMGKNNDKKNAELPEPEEVYCEWRERDTEIDADKLYNTSCGKTSVMLAGGGYCNHCGRKRKIKQEAK